VRSSRIVSLAVAALATGGALALVALRDDRPPAPAGLAAAEDHPGRELYRRFGCFKCHSLDLRGTHKGPPLVDTRERWDVAELTEYLRDPRPFLEQDPRLRDLARAYQPVEMPAFSVHQDKLQEVAAYLLEVSD